MKPFPMMVAVLALGLAGPALAPAGPTAGEPAAAPRSVTGRALVTPEQPAAARGQVLAEPGTGRTGTVGENGSGRRGEGGRSERGSNRGRLFNWGGRAP